MQKQAGRPNLLYIHSDQHSSYVLGCGGDPIVQTPNLDRLAGRGVLLENAYCPSPLCVASRMSMLTGRYPCENRVWAKKHVLDSGIPTFAHAMGAARYCPVLIGRMHAIGPDQLHGYADRLVGDHAPNHPGSRGHSHGMLSGTASPTRTSLLKSGSGQSAYQVHDEDVTAATVGYLNRLGVQKRAGLTTEPFCVTVGFMLPHQPFVARREDYDRYRDIVTLPAHPKPFSDALHPYFRWWRQKCRIEEVSDEEALRARAAYWALVTRLDAMIGEILFALENNGLEENTLIVYSSDHGEQVGEHGLWWKQTFYEESVKVPTILSWSGVLPQGLRLGRVISSLDINATMLHALGAPALPESRGRSILDLVKNPEDEDWEDVAFSEYCTDGGCFHRMVRSGPWKLNYYHGQDPQLFNLEEDPHELVDRSRDPVCQDVLQALTACVLDGWDPDSISKDMALKRADLSVLVDWARHTHPEDRYRWELRPEMNYLD